MRVQQKVKSLHNSFYKELINDTQSNFDDDQLSDFCEVDRESGRNVIKFLTVARECDRYGVSDAAGADIAAAALSDYGTIKKHDKEAIIDRANLSR